MMGLIIDNFAGGGGASTGIELALGRPVDIAINHDEQAIAMHKMNHPFTFHYHDDVFNIKPKEATKGKPVDLCWLSPDCTHFSKAKGGVPVSKKIRGLAWIAVKWAANVFPRVIILENVEEFKTWGPLDKNGYPDKTRQGETFRKFVKTLESFGYSVAWKELRACDYGAPTSRKRFFMVARIDGQPIIWPEPTHSKDGKLLPKWKSAASIIDWSIPTKSIFERKKPLSDATNRRIARGIKKFILDNPKPFILSSNFNNVGSIIDSPLPTITTQRNHSALITPFVAQTGHTGFKSNRNRNIGDPISTIVTKNEHLLISPLLTPFMIDYHFNNKPFSVEEPHKTITTVRGQYLVAPLMTPMGWKDNAGKRTADIKEPLQTITAGGNKFAITAATLIQTGYGEAPGQLPRVPGLNKPLGTLVSTNKHGLVTAFLDRYFSGSQQKGVSISSPVPTVTTLPRVSFVTASIVKNYGGNYQGSGSNINDPLSTVTAWDHNALLVCSFLDKYYGTSRVGQDLLRPLGTITAKDHYALVTVNIKGTEYVISDIGMRMLVPRELYNAQGFPKDYIIDRDSKGDRITISQQIAKCGNSVPPAFSEALVRANLPDLAAKKKITTMKDLHRYKETVDLFDNHA
ncbi:MAG: DNA cytosine methyltransferase [Candidatus Izemoplasmatales bacterium]|jgi:DNA (cytosine-5)-methyltransferase 1